MMPQAQVANTNPVPHNDERNEEILLRYVGVLFLIDDEGRIWRIAEMRRGTVTPCERRRAEYPATNGYLRVRMSLNGIRIRASAHRIVYRYFKGEIPKHAIVNHDDRVRSNNRPGNLLPASQSFNIKHGARWDKCKN